MGHHMFMNCYSLESIVVPDKVTTFGNDPYR